MSTQYRSPQVPPLPVSHFGVDDSAPLDDNWFENASTDKDTACGQDDLRVLRAVSIADDSAPCVDNLVANASAAKSATLGQDDLRALLATSKRRVPAWSRKIVLKGVVALVSSVVATTYSAYRIVQGEVDFHAHERKQQKNLCVQMLGAVQRQLETSVSSTRALAAFIKLNEGAELIAPLGANVHELIAAAEAVAQADANNASQAVKDLAAQRKENATKQMIDLSSRLSFNQVAQELIDTYRGISNLQLAPAGVVSAIHPLEGNEPAMGHDLFFDKNRRDGAMKAVARQDVIFVGPLTLIQNGKSAIIARFPVYVPGHKGPLDSHPMWWGFATMICELEDFFDGLQIEDAEDLGISFAIVARVGEELRPLLASADVKKEIASHDSKALVEILSVHDPVVTSFKLDNLNIHWEMHSWPTGGWQEMSDTFAMQTGLCVCFTLCGLASVYAMLVRDSVVHDLGRILSPFVLSEAVSANDVDTIGKLLSEASAAASAAST